MNFWNELNANITVNVISNLMQGSALIVLQGEDYLSSNVEPIIHNDLDASIRSVVGDSDYVIGSLFVKGVVENDLDASINPKLISDLNASIEVSYYNIMSGTAVILSSILNSDVDVSIEPIIHSDLDAYVTPSFSNSDYIIGSINSVFVSSANLAVSINVIVFADLDCSLIVKYFNKMSVNYVINPPPAEEVDFLPVQDAFVRSTIPTLNYGTEEDMLIGNSGLPEFFRSLLQFDLSSIPAGRDIESAELILHLATEYFNESNLELHYIASAWTELGVTWNNQPASDGLITSFTSGLGYTTISIDVYSAVYDWVINGRDNFGFLIKAENESLYELIRYFTRESAEPPILRVNHFDPVVRLRVDRNDLDCSINVRAYGLADLVSSLEPKSYDVDVDLSASILVREPGYIPCSISVSHPYLPANITVIRTELEDLDASIIPVLFNDLSVSIFVRDINISDSDSILFNDFAWIEQLEFGFDYINSSESTSIDKELILSDSGVFYDYLYFSLVGSDSFNLDTDLISELEIKSIETYLLGEYIYSDATFPTYDAALFIDIVEASTYSSDSSSSFDTLTDLNILVSDAYNFIELLLDKSFNSVDVISSDSNISLDFAGSDSTTSSDSLSEFAIAVYDTLTSDDVLYIYNKELIQYDSALFVEDLEVLREAFKDLDAYITPRFSDYNEILGAVFVDTGIYWVELTLDTTPPQDVEIFPNLGEEFTMEQIIPIEILTSDESMDNYYVKIWGDLNLDFNSNIQDTELNSTWIPIGDLAFIKFSDNFEYKTIYAKLRDDVGNEADTVSSQVYYGLAIEDLDAEITARVKGASDLPVKEFIDTGVYWVGLYLDTTPPEDAVLLVNDGIPQTVEDVIPIELTTSDTGVGGYYMKVWGDVNPLYDLNVQTTEEASSWVPYYPFLNVMLATGYGTKNIYAIIRDDVGNETAILSGSTLYQIDYNPYRTEIVPISTDEWYVLDLILTDTIIGTELTTIDFIAYDEATLTEFLTVGLKLFDTATLNDVVTQIDLISISDTSNFSDSAKQIDLINLYDSSSMDDTQSSLDREFVDTITLDDTVSKIDIIGFIDSGSLDDITTQIDIIDLTDIFTSDDYIIERYLEGFESGSILDTFIQIDLTSLYDINTFLDKALQIDLTTLTDAYSSSDLISEREFFLLDYIALERELVTNINIDEVVDLYDLDEEHWIEIINLFDSAVGSDYISGFEIQVTENITYIDSTVQIDLIELYDNTTILDTHWIGIIELYDNVTAIDSISKLELPVFENIIYNDYLTQIDIVELYDTSSLGENHWIGIINLFDTFTWNELIIELDREFFDTAIIEDINKQIDLTELYDTSSLGENHWIGIINLFDSGTAFDYLSVFEMMVFESGSLEGNFVQIDLLNITDLVLFDDTNKQIDLINLYDSAVFVDYVSLEFNVSDNISSLDKAININVIELEGFISSDKSIQIDLINILDIFTSYEVFNKEFPAFDEFLSECENVLVWGENLAGRDVSYPGEVDYTSDGTQYENPLFGNDIVVGNVDYPYEEIHPNFGDTITIYNEYLGTLNATNTYNISMGYPIYSVNDKSGITNEVIGTSMYGSGSTSFRMYLGYICEDAIIEGEVVDSFGLDIGFIAQAYPTASDNVLTLTFRRDGSIIGTETIIGSSFSNFSIPYNAIDGGSHFIDVEVTLTGSSSVWILGDFNSHILHWAGEKEHPLLGWKFFNSAYTREFFLDGIVPIALDSVYTSEPVNVKLFAKACDGVFEHLWDSFKDMPLDYLYAYYATLEEGIDLDYEFFIPIDKIIAVDSAPYLEINVLDSFSSSELIVFLDFTTYDDITLDDKLVNIEVDSSVDLYDLEENHWIEIIELYDNGIAEDIILYKEVVVYDYVQALEGTFIFEYNYQGNVFSYPNEDATNPCVHPTYPVVNPLWGADILPTDADYDVDISSSHYGEVVSVYDDVTLAGDRFVSGYHTYSVIGNQDTTHIVDCYLGYGTGNLHLNGSTGGYGLFYTWMKVYHDDTLLYEVSKFTRDSSLDFNEWVAYDTTTGSPFIRLEITNYSYLDPVDGYINGTVNFYVIDYWNTQYEVLPEGLYYDSWYTGTPREEFLYIELEQPYPCDLACSDMANIGLYVNADWLINGYDWLMFQHYPLDGLYNVLVDNDDYTLNYNWLFVSECPTFEDTTLNILLSGFSDTFNFLDSAYISYKEIFHTDTATISESIVDSPIETGDDFITGELNLIGILTKDDISITDYMWLSKWDYLYEYFYFEDKAIIELYVNDAGVVTDTFIQIDLKANEDVSFNEDVDVSYKAEDAFYFNDEFININVLEFEALTLTDTFIQIDLINIYDFANFVDRVFVEFELIDFVESNDNLVELNIVESDEGTTDTNTIISLTQTDSITFGESKFITIDDVVDIFDLDEFAYITIPVYELIYLDDSAVIEIYVNDLGTTDEYVLEKDFDVLDSNGYDENAIIDISVYDYWFYDSNVIVVLYSEDWIYFYEQGIASLLGTDEINWDNEYSLIDRFIYHYETFIDSERVIQIDLTEIFDTFTFYDRLKLSPLFFEVNWLDISAITDEVDVEFEVIEKDGLWEINTEFDGSLEFTLNELQLFTVNEVPFEVNVIDLGLTVNELETINVNELIYDMNVKELDYNVSWNMLKSFTINLDIDVGGDE